MANKLDTAMWLSRLFTVYCSALFVLPLLGYVLYMFLPLVFTCSLFLEYLLGVTLVKLQGVQGQIKHRSHP